MRRYALHWLSREIEVVEGESIKDAMSRAGYGASAVRALDRFEEIGTVEKALIVSSPKKKTCVVELEIDAERIARDRSSLINKIRRLTVGHGIRVAKVWIKGD